MDTTYNPFSLVGKTILVTGASSGIGRAIAIECSKMGAQVVITGRNSEKLEQTLAQMCGDGHRVILADLTKEEDIIRLVAQLPPLNGVVQNAGVGSRTLAKNVKITDINTVMLPNFYGPVVLQSHLLKKKIVAKEASIVFVASRAPFAPSIGNALYSASKGALIAYTKVLGLEVAPQKIRVNSICPAMIWTELVKTDAEMTGGDYVEAELKYPLKRYGNPEDIAYLAIYLLSDASSWMTGSCIDITGGGEFTLT
ncbi:MAG: SDR family oxidoreductase [Alistipes sp.]